MAKHDLQISPRTSSSYNHFIQKEELSFLLDTDLKSSAFSASISMLARKLLKLGFPSKRQSDWLVAEIYRLLTGWPQQVNILLDIVNGKHGDPVSALSTFIRPMDSVVCDTDGMPSVFHQRGVIFIKNLNFTMSNTESFNQGVWYQNVPKSHPSWLLSRQIVKHNDSLPVWEANNGPLSSVDFGKEE